MKTPVSVQSDDSPQPLVEHLEELRRRLLISLVFFVIFFGVGYSIMNPVLSWLAKPVGQFVFLGPTDAFFIRIKIAAGIGLILGFPFFLYQAWRFIAVALKSSERHLFKWILPVSCLLFFFGLALALFGVMPIAIRFLLTFSTPELKPLISIQAYMSFLLWMILGFGLLFQLPLFVVVLCRVGILSTAQLRHYRKHIIVGLVIVAAFLSPGPDVVSQLILTLPSYLLFEIALLVAKAIEKK